MTIDPQNYLTIDVPCLGCGYNLRGLQPDSLCPECGKSIQHSLQPNLLRYADPKWLRGLVRGMDLVVAAGLAAVACGLLTVIVTTIWQNSPSDPAIACLLMTYFVAVLLCLFGVLALTSPDPGQVDEPSRSPRRSMRVWACSAFAAGGTLLLTLPLSDPLLSISCLGVSVIAGFMGLLATLRYARQLADRLPGESLSRSTRLLRIGFIASGTCCLGSIVILAPTSMISNKHLENSIGICASSFFLTGVILTLALLLVLAIIFVAFHTALRLALAQAKEASGQ